eukprot:scaffold17724_cov129-Isochrysis_galbana.AAC.3
MTHPRFAVFSISILSLGAAKDRPITDTDLQSEERWATPRASSTRCNGCRRIFVLTINFGNNGSTTTSPPRYTPHQVQVFSSSVTTLQRLWAPTSKVKEFSIAGGKCIYSFSIRNQVHGHRALSRSRGPPHPSRSLPTPALRNNTAKAPRVSLASCPTPDGQVPKPWTLGESQTRQLASRNAQLRQQRPRDLPTRLRRGKRESRKVK